MTNKPPQRADAARDWVVAPIDEHEHILACPVCSQRFDARKLEAVIHHAGLPHAPSKQDA